MLKLILDIFNPQCKEHTKKHNEFWKAVRDMKKEKKSTI